MIATQAYRPDRHTGQQKFHHEGSTHRTHRHTVLPHRHTGTQACRNSTAKAAAEKLIEESASLSRRTSRRSQMIYAATSAKRKCLVDPSHPKSLNKLAHT